MASRFQSGVNRGVVQTGLTDHNQTGLARVGPERLVKIVIDTRANGLNRQAHRLAPSRPQTP